MQQILKSAFCIAQALHPDGSCLVTGGRRGALHRWSLPDRPGPRDGRAAAAAASANGSNSSRAQHPAGSSEAARSGQALPSLRDSCQPLHLEGSGHSDTIDRMVHSTITPL